MAFNVNGAAVKKITFGGHTVKKVLVNGTKVWNSYTNMLVAAFSSSTDEYSSNYGSSMYYSLDKGATWVQCSVPSTVQQICSVVYGNGRYVARIKSSYMPYRLLFMYSTDGINWTVCNSIASEDFDTFYRTTLFFSTSGNKFIGFALRKYDRKYYAFTSSDGNNWTWQTSFSTSNSVYASTEYNTTPYIVADNGNVYMTTDGSSFTLQQATGSTISYLLNQGVCENASGMGYAFCATNGVMWSYSSSAIRINTSPGYSYAINRIDGVVYAFGVNGTYYSTDNCSTFVRCSGNYPSANSGYNNRSYFFVGEDGYLYLIRSRGSDIETFLYKMDFSTKKWELVAYPKSGMFAVASNREE